MRLRKSCPACGQMLEEDQTNHKAYCPSCGALYRLDDEGNCVEDASAATNMARLAGDHLPRTGDSDGETSNATTSAKPSPQPGRDHVGKAPYVAPVRQVRTRRSVPVDRSLVLGIAGVAATLVALVFYLAHAPSTGTGNAPGPDAPAETTGASLPIEIRGGEQGAYGKPLTVYEGTSLEERYIAHYLPEGTYKVRNLGTGKATLNVYGGLDRGPGGDQWSDYGDRLSLERGEEGTVHVPAGWFAIASSARTHLMLVPEGMTPPNEYFTLDAAPVDAKDAEDDDSLGYWFDMLAGSDGSGDSSIPPELLERLVGENGEALSQLTGGLGQ